MAETNKKQEQYRVRCWGACAQSGQPCGIDYPTNKGQVRRVEGEIADGLPAQSIRGELAAGHIEAVTADRAGED